MVVRNLTDLEEANTAESLLYFDLTIPLDELVKLPPDSYYQHDILGLQVRTLRGHEIGMIEDIMVTGSNDVYIIKAPDGKQILVPAIKDVVKQIDLIRKMMYIEPIAGLLDNDETVDFPEEE